MRLSAISVVALLLTVGHGSDEPSEAAMKRAFSARLMGDVARALEFAGETGGAEALARIRAAGTDRFDIRSFTKRDCTRVQEYRGHVCGFAVDIDAAGGMVRHTLTGRFHSGLGGLVFVYES
jgi:hypothetical protein